MTIVADFDSDIYEEFIEVPDDKTDLLIRSAQDRKLYDCDSTLFEYLSHLESQGTYQLEISIRQKKRVPRLATMFVQFDKVKIARPSSPNKAGYPSSSRIVFRSGNRIL